MGMLKDKDKAEITKILADLESDVRLVMFTQANECQYCQMTHDLMTELAELAPRLTLEVHDFVGEAELASRYGIDKIPAVAVVGARDYGVRFYGIPAGYEFASLLEAITDVAADDPGLPPEILDSLAKVDQPVRMQVMVTPT
jgi:glutaredoxin-like protein